MASLVDNMDGLAVADAVVVAGGVSGTVAGTSAEHMMNPGTLEIEVIQGRDLVIKDRGTFRSNKSDPFCVVAVDGAKVGKTKTVDRNLSPVWNFSTAAKVKRGAQKRLVVNCFDKDKLSSSDPMGTVVIEVLEALRGADVATRVRRWYDVENCEGCDNARGQIEIAFAWKPKTVIALEKGTPFRVEHPEQALFVGLGWTGACGAKVDLDASCVFFDDQGAVVDALYFGNTQCFDGAALHSGDALTGDEAAAEEDADERIELRLAKLPRAVASMLFVVTAYAEKSSFVDMKSAFVGLFDPVEGEMCRYAFDCRGDHTGLVMCRVARSGPAWVLNAIGDVAAGPRDYGTWVPELKAYLSDLVSHVRVGDPNDRVAIMHKGSVVDLSYYQAGPLAEVRMGVAWDITGGRSIDLDASCLLLKAGCSEATTEIVSYQKLSSSDGRVRHSGDDTTGDGGGDDEVITVELDKLAPDVRYVAFVVNSYSGQPFSQVDNVSCHLFLPPSRARPKPQDLAIFNLSSKTYHTTALVMTILERSTRPDGSPTWLMRAVGEGTEAKVAKQCLDEIQLVLTGAKERDF